MNTKLALLLSALTLAGLAVALTGWIHENSGFLEFRIHRFRLATG